MVSVKYKILIIKSVTTMGIKMERERKFRNFHKASNDSICDDKNDHSDAHACRCNKFEQKS